MPRLAKAFPKYRRKIKSSGPQAVVTLNGKDHYLGPYGSQASKLFYDRLIAEWLVAGRQSPSTAATTLTVEELIARYWEHAQEFYRRADGTPTPTASNMKPILRVIRRMYGDTDAEEFGPIALKAVRLRFVEMGHSRRTVNDYVDRIKHMFRWGVSEELVDESVVRRLDTVAGLRKGKTEAPDHAPIPPIGDEVVLATMPYLPPVIADMVRFARYTGARPGEICIIRPCDIDRTSEVWLYIPERHKTAHHDKSRAVAVGPKAREIIRSYLEREAGEYCFKPSEAVELYRKQRHAERRTPLSCGNRPGSKAAKRGRRKRRDAQPRDCYDDNSFRRAIHRACDRAFSPPVPLAPRPHETITARNRRLTEKQRAELKKWQSDHRWSPNQLRHSAATEIRQRFGIEAVAAVLGHSKTDTSEIYALRNLTLAASIANEIG